MIQTEMGVVSLGPQRFMDKARQCGGLAAAGERLVVCNVSTTAREYVRLWGFDGTLYNWIHSTNR